MLYFVAEDSYHYEKEQVDELKKKHGIEELIIMPQLENIQAVARTMGQANSPIVACLSPLYPEQLHEGFASSSFLEVIVLKNKYDPFTKEQIEHKLNQHKILSNKLGVKIAETSLTFANYGGETAGILVSEARKIETKIALGLKPKGFFIVGLPGTGKSFFAKCFAGETKRKLVEFSISKIMESPRPLLKIETVLDYLKNTPGKYLIWIDEIEKMFANENSQQILGVFLTELNEFQSGVSNAFFIATANNIEAIARNNPEMLRPGGRFDKLVYLLPSTESGSVDIFKIYVDEKKKHFRQQIVPAIILEYLYGAEVLGISYKKTRIVEAALFVEKEIPLAASALSDAKIKFAPYAKIIIGADSSAEMEALRACSNKLYSECKAFAEKSLALEYSPDEKYRLSKNVFNSILEQEAEKSYAIRSLVDKIETEFGFDLDIQKIVTSSAIKYRDSLVERNRYAYTPSEIQTLVMEIYSEYYMGEARDETLEQTAERFIQLLVPIQIQFKDGISKMSSNAEKFLHI